MKNEDFIEISPIRRWKVLKTMFTNGYIYDSGHSVLYKYGHERSNHTYSLELEEYNRLRKSITNCSLCNDSGIIYRPEWSRCSRCFKSLPEIRINSETREIYVI